MSASVSACEIVRSRHEAGGIAIRYLGQAGFLLQRGGLSVAIDPYLSDAVDRLPEFPPGFWRRAYAPPVDPATLGALDLVLCTHDHLDHTDPETLRAIAQASPRCRFAAPAAAARAIVAAGISSDRVIVARAGETFGHGALTVRPVAAAHEGYEVDAVGNDRWLGYLLEWDGITLFHAGDTMATPRLEEEISAYRIDVGFFPVNGGDATRREYGIVGNMDAAAAMGLAARRRFGLVVPTHYDLYPCNGAALADVVAAWEALPFEARPAFKAFLPGEQIVHRRDDGRHARPLSVIVGAGKTGRGFLARLLEASGDTVVFIDRSEALVDRLNADGSYAIHFFGGVRASRRFDRVAATRSGSTLALDWLARARAVYTAVGESNVASLVPDLAAVLDRRRKEGASPLHVIVCENGVSPASPLRDAFAARGAEIEIGEAAIFCSTIELPGTRLDIQSEAYDELPYDAPRLARLPAFPGLRPVTDFPTLLKRKIYTYNCFSACIAYLGAHKGYQWYADAACDPDVSRVLDHVAAPLNAAICAEFGIAPEEQAAFSADALRKFRDQNIRDDIARNARNVARKLAPDDRLVAPARLIAARGGSIDALAEVMAAALLYDGPEEAALQGRLREEPVETVFAGISQSPLGSPLVEAVARHYLLLREAGSNPRSSMDELLPRSESPKI